MRQLFIVPAILLLGTASLLAQSYGESVGEAQQRTRTTDPSLTQIYTGYFGWSLTLPADTIAKFNKIGSTVNASGKSEVVNFMLRNGRGGMYIRYYTEQRMLPLGYGILDSTVHFYEADSVGRNGHIYRRTYVMTDQAVEIEINLTEKGQADLGNKIQAIFDSFLPPKEATFALQGWRYGRSKADYEAGRSAAERSK